MGKPPLWKQKSKIKSKQKVNTVKTNKKGYVLLEVILSMFITMILTTASIVLLMKAIGDFNNMLSENSEKAVFNSHCEYIDTYITSQIAASNITLSENKIYIDSASDRIIALDSRNSQLALYKVNMVLDRKLVVNVKDFQVKIKNQLLWIFIEDKEEHKWERIISIKKAT